MVDCYTTTCADAKELFSDTGIGITSEGKCHLAAALGSHSFIESYISDKVKVWTSTILNLSLIAKTHLMQPTVLLFMVCRGFGLSSFATIESPEVVSHICACVMVVTHPL